VGAFTAIFAATIALRQFDLKKVFAYSTVSQLGFMFAGVGLLAPVAGVFHLVTHAFFKALLFLSSGVVMHAMLGHLDMRKMSGLKRVLPKTRWLMLIGCAISGTASLITSTIPAETVPPQHLATAIGLIIAVGVIIGGLAGPGIAGWVADTQGLGGPLLLQAGYAIATFILAAGLRAGPLR